MRLCCIGLMACALLLGPELKAQKTELRSAHTDERIMLKGCGSCHQGHGARGTLMLPANGAQACLTCHAGPNAYTRTRVQADAEKKLLDLRRDFNKPYRHPIETARLHRRGERLPENSGNQPRHVACRDCHDYHGTRVLDEASHPGTRQRAATLRRFRYQYEVCYQCHGESQNRPVEAKDIRLLTNAGNASSHPIESAGASGKVPSLLQPYNEQSVISCSDCHGSDDPELANAPHGSIYPGLLRESYNTQDRQPESEQTYRLCYRCHDRYSLLRNESFSLHQSHIQMPKPQTSCYTCHSSHGSRRNPWLIEFNPVVVRANQASQLLYRSTGTRRGECFLSCHGVDHNPGRYCPDQSACDPGRVRALPGLSSQSSQKSGISFDQPPSVFNDGSGL